MDERQRSAIAASLYDAVGSGWPQRAQFESASHGGGHQEIERNGSIPRAFTHPNINSLDNAALAWPRSSGNGELRGINASSRFFRARTARGGRAMTREQVVFLITSFCLIAILSATITARVISMAEQATH